MRMKKAAALFGVVLCILIWAPKASARTALRLAPAVQTDQPSVDELETYLLEEEWLDFFEEQPVSWKELRSMQPGQLLRYLWQQILDRLQVPVKTALRITGILLLLGMFRLICRDSAPPELDHVLQSVTTVVLFLLLSTPVMALLSRFCENVEQCRVFLAQFIPVMGGILTAGGQAGTAAVYTTGFLGVILAVSETLHSVISPLIRVFLALAVTKGLCGSLRLDGIIGLMRSAVNWTMGLTTTVFGAYLGFQSVLANAADSLAMKAGRFVLAGGIPLVGGMVSEAIGTVYSGLKLVKSAAGILGVAALLLLFLPQLLECILYGFVCRIGAAAAMLLENNAAKGLLDGIAESLRMLSAVMVLYLLLTVFSTALMVLLNTGVG